MSVLARLHSEDEFSFSIHINSSYSQRGQDLVPAPFTSQPGFVSSLPFWAGKLAGLIYLAQIWECSTRRILTVLIDI